MNLEEQMNFPGIEAFLAIVDHKNMSKAAAALFLSQSTISHRLHALEKELNTKLIERKKGCRTIELTAKGEEFIKIAERWMALWKDTQHFLGSSANLSLSLGAVESLNVHVFVPFYKLISDHNSPPINLEIKSHWSRNMYSAMDNREIDAGFVLAATVFNNIVTKPIFSEKLLLICPVSGKPRNYDVHPSELDPNKEVKFHKHLEYQQWHDYWWGPIKYPCISIDSSNLIATFLDHPDRWAIISASIVKSLNKDHQFEVHNLISPPPDRICYLITHRFPKPGSIKSLEIMQHFLEQFLTESEQTGLLTKLL
jgi:DNA-binding transcriptional LysR family regulator